MAYSTERKEAILKNSYHSLPLINKMVTEVAQEENSRVRGLENSRVRGLLLRIAVRIAGSEVYF